MGQDEGVRSETQLWLNVFENPSGSDWPPSVEQMQWRVSITAAATLQGCNHDVPFRTSPVHPVSADFLIPEFSGKTLFVCFFCFDPAFEVISRVVENATGDLRRTIFATLGLASVVVVSPNPEALDEVVRLAKAKPRTTERWTVTDGKVVKVEYHAAESVVKKEVLRVCPYESLPLAPRTVIDEFLASMGLLLPKVALHVPDELSTFERLVGLVDELIVEMLYATNPDGVPPASLSEYDQPSFLADMALRETVLHQNVDRLVQINASLAYLATQAFSGAVPILERRSLIRRYSLLGVGTAILALTRIARNIERAFAKGAVESIIADRMGDAAPLAGLERLPDYNPKDWAVASVDRWAGKVATRESYPKLPYFSGRLGFRETEYTISAALQCLAAGAAPEWSLLTMTHEMVHGHVRNMIALIFQGDPNRIPDRRWSEFYSRFERLAEGSRNTDESLLDSVRGVILAYACLALTHGSLTRASDRRVDPASREIRLDFVLPQPEALWAVFEGEIRNISEILVHVLDLHYFYRSSLTAYIPMIWRSWATLPQVKGDLRQYLLRSLLVVAVKSDSATPYERFRQARLRLAELLNLAEQGESMGRGTIAKARQLIESSEAENFYYPFRAGLLLADLAHHVFTSSAIRGSLHGGDPFLVIKRRDDSYEEWLEYTIPEGFTDSVVHAPAAFIANEVSKGLGKESSASLEFDTVRMFIACCSHIENGVKNAAAD